VDVLLVDRRVVPPGQGSEAISSSREEPNERLNKKLCITLAGDNIKNY
jgi:hypothetical protein